MVDDQFEIVIVGGGPAGLSAALMLGRARRRVLVLDAGRPRNAKSHAMHGYLSRDGCSPADFRARALDEVRAYPSVTLRHAIASDASHEDGRFLVTLEDGATVAARKLLLATGVVDHLPDLPGIEDYYGTSVHHCPYCDGYEYRDQPLIVVGPSAKCAGMARMMTRWSADVSFAPDDADSVSEAEAGDFERAGVRLLRSPVVALVGEDGQLAAAVLADGSRRPCRALFFNTGQHQRSPLITKLGVDLTAKGGAITDRREEAHIRGLFVAGDATRDVQFVIVAAAEGATAALAIDKELMIEDGVLRET